MFAIGDRVTAYCPIRQKYLSGTVTAQIDELNRLYGYRPEVVAIRFDGDSEDYRYTANNVVPEVATRKLGHIQSEQGSNI